MALAPAPLEAGAGWAGAAVVGEGTGGNVATADYLQPFPSVVVELPADSTRKRVVPFEEGSHAPDFAIVRHEPEAGCVLATMPRTSGRVLADVASFQSQFPAVASQVVASWLAGVKGVERSGRERWACPGRSVCSP
jgi:hypothetical protein